MFQTTDREIRAAFHKKNLKRYHDSANTLVIDELGIAHGKARVDIAVLNGFVHGYEIKSSKDTLNRLSGQFDIYKKSLEKITIIASENHMTYLEQCAPTWCGLILASKGQKQAIHFTNIRSAKLNPEIDTFHLAHLLWKKEAVKLLLRLGEEPEKLNCSRSALYSKLSLKLSSRELSKKIKDSFTERGEWRAEKLQSQYDGLRQLASK